ncbi:MAG: chromosome segregation protein SMC [Verrucomicrobiota bacterium]
MQRATSLASRHSVNISEASAKKERQQSDIEAADRQLAAVNERILEERDKVAALEEKTREARSIRETVNRRLRELEEERSQLKSRVGSLDATIETNTSQLESDQQRARQLNDEISRLREDETVRKSDASELKERITSHQRSIEEFEERLAEMDQKYHQAKRAAAAMQEDLSSLNQLHAEKRSRLEVLEQLVSEGEGFEKGTQSVLQGVDGTGRFDRKVLGPLSRTVDVELKYAEAVEAALGNRLQTVLVSDREASEQIISSLRENQLGQASLIAQSDLEKNRPGVSEEAPLGAIGWAIDLIAVEKPVLGLLQQLLDRVLIAEDLKTALRLREEHDDVAIASLDGSFVSREGIIQGGRSSDESVSVLKMQGEIAELKSVSDALQKEVTVRQEKKDDLNARVDQLEETLQGARERLQQKRVASSTLEGKLALVERDLNQFRNKIESLEWEQREVRERESKIAADREANESARSEANSRIDSLSEESASLSSRLDTAQEEEENLTEEVTEARTSLAVEDGTRQNLEEQREPMVARLNELTELIERADSEIGNYRERITRANEESEQLQHRISDWKEETEKTHEERSGILVKKSGYSAQIEEGEEELTQKRRAVQDVASQRGKEEVKVAQLDLGLENLERTCRDRYRTELEFFEPDSHALLLAIEERRKNGAARPKPIPEAPEDSEEPSEVDSAEAETQVEDPAEPDWEFVEEVVTQLRTKLDSMGPVNIDAIEEFDELEEHYRFNVNQLEDLENSKEELLRMIARINRDTRKMFSETFEKIRRNFRDMFKELFGEKSKADLLLMDDSDPLESGIDIIAKPPGKKLQSISLMSGGERSMTAVALLFGIYMVKPSPFCVLDELDAPLDEANIGRFIRVLDRFIGGSQFVIVTHSKRTMSRADVMYGVSMEEFGVSKTVGVTFSKADEAKGLKKAGIGG